MIGIDGMLCYSPEPPEAYTRNTMNGVMGHGLYPKGDIPMWNMLWLSFPSLDLYLDERVTLTQILAYVPAQNAGAAMSVVSPLLTDALQGLRDSLTSMPSRFLSFSDSFPWEALVVYHELGGEEWVTNMRRRAMLAMGQETKVAAVKRSLGSNVISVMFGK